MSPIYLLLSELINFAKGTWMNEWNKYLRNIFMKSLKRRRLVVIQNLWKYFIRILIILIKSLHIIYFNAFLRVVELLFMSIAVMAVTIYPLTGNPIEESFIGLLNLSLKLFSLFKNYSCLDSKRGLWVPWTFKNCFFKL